MAEKWMQGAVKKPGALTEQAKRAGMSIGEFCKRRGKHGKAAKRCALRKTFNRYRPTGRR